MRFCFCMIFYYSLITVPTLVTLHSFTIMKHLKIFIYIIFFFWGGGGMIHWEMLVKTTRMFYSINFDIWINLVYMYVMLKYCISVYMYNTHEEQLSKTQMVYIFKVWWKHLELLLSFCKLNTGLYNHIVINGQKDGKQKCQTL